MASQLSWLSTCKLSQLKVIASATGINCSGTKPVLSARLLENLQHTRFALDSTTRNGQPKRHTIISIDMGIRNLAYCRLVLPSSQLSSSNSAVPIVKDWARIAISKKSLPLEGDFPESKIIKEAFDPPTYSQHAYSLIANTLLPLKPTQILIERQRFRSMGGSSVQEWTLRVNMFEAMLYAVLKTLSERGLWSGAVHPVAPGKVVKYWAPGTEDREAGEGKGAKKSAKMKTQKVELVERWLKNGGVFGLEGQAKELGEAYLKKRKGGKMVVIKQEKRPSEEERVPVPAEIGKLDDLADCLLQGMAWIRWEENRILFVSKGLKALEELA